MQVRSFRAGNNLLGDVEIINIISLLLVTSLLLFLLLHCYYVAYFVRTHDLKNSPTNGQLQWYVPSSAIQEICQFQ